MTRPDGSLVISLLCYFHMLQSWDRELKSNRTGVVTPEQRAVIMQCMRNMRFAADPIAFHRALGDFTRFCETQALVCKSAHYIFA
jgi:hypothetical protein